jgi:hypothetical protein
MDGDGRAAGRASDEQKPPWEALMKRGCLTTLVVFALGIGALVAGYMYQCPVYSYRYRLTVNVEIDGKVHSGSSVIEIGWQEGIKLGDSGGFAPIIRGQAPVVDLGDRGVVVATLINGESYGPAMDGALGAQWITPRAFGRKTNAEEIPTLPELQGKRDLALDNLPRFLWFSNPQDPTTAKKLLVQDIPGTFGPSARFAGASVEITSDPIVVDINRKLPWFQSWSDHYRDRGPIYLQNKLGLSRYMFVGDAS